MGYMTKHNLDEVVLLQLIQCPFSGIKKTCFLLLKQLYELKLVKTTIPDIFKEILCLNLKNT